MIQIGRQHNPIETITQHIYPVPQEQKMELLLYMLQSQRMYSVLVFSRTKRGADRICRKLKKNDIKAEAIHSDRNQRQRMRALDGFKRGKYQVMVATDVAARGINVEGISHVFNFDVPTFPEDYVHRIGRTGRAEATGDAITFVGYDEIPLIGRIERFIDRKFKGEYCEGFEYKQRLSLSNGPRIASGKKKRPGSAQRKRSKSKRWGQGGESKQKSGGFDKKKNAGAPKRESIKAKKDKNRTESESKKSFKRKAKPNRGSKPGAGSFKRSKKKSANNSRHKSS
jgi:ATP-dependent RNA helicase RhlE